MGIHKLDSILLLKRCPDEIALKIINAAELGIDQWDDDIAKHLTGCQSCRLMLVDYIMLDHDILSDELTENSDIVDSIIFFTSGAVDNQQNQTALNKQMIFRGAASSSAKKEKKSKFVITDPTCSFKGEIRWKNGNAEILLSNINLDDKYYLEKFDDKKRLNGNTTEDKIIFTNIVPGIYILAREKYKAPLRVIIIKAE
jgi:hypothetical protein